MVEDIIHNSITSTQKEIDELKSDLRLVNNDVTMKVIIDRIEDLKRFIIRSEYDLSQLQKRRG